MESRAIQVKCCMHATKAHVRKSEQVFDLCFHLFPVLRSTGFILEGFPQNPEEVAFLAERHLYPDAVVVMTLEVAEVASRLLPPLLARWRKRRERKREQNQLLKELRGKIRVRLLASSLCSIPSTHAVRVVLK